MRKYLTNKRVRFGLALANLPNVIAIPAGWHLAATEPMSLTTLKMALTGALSTFSTACVAAIAICFVICVYGNILLFFALKQVRQAT